MVFTSSKRNQERNILYISRKSIFNTVNSHVNSSKSNNMNTSNSNNAIVNSNLPRINVETKRSFNKLIALQTETDTESISSIKN